MAVPQSAGTTRVGQRCSARSKASLCGGEGRHSCTREVHDGLHVCGCGETWTAVWRTPGGLMPVLAERARAFREVQGFSVRDLQKLSHVPRTTLNGWERRDARAQRTNVRKVERGLGVPPGVLSERLTADQVLATAYPGVVRGNATTHRFGPGIRVCWTTTGGVRPSTGTSAAGFTLSTAAPSTHPRRLAVRIL